MIDNIFFINLILLLSGVHHLACCSRTWFEPYWDEMLSVCMKMIKALGLTSSIQTVPENYILSEPPWACVQFFCLSPIYEFWAYLFILVLMTSRAFFDSFEQWLTFKCGDFFVKGWKFGGNQEKKKKKKYQVLLWDQWVAIAMSYEKDTCWYEAQL